MTPTFTMDLDPTAQTLTSLAAGTMQGMPSSSPQQQPIQSPPYAWVSLSLRRGIEGQGSGM